MLPALLINKIVPAIAIPFLILDFIAILTMLMSQKLRKRNASIFLITIFLSDILSSIPTFYLWAINMEMTSFYKFDKINYVNETGKLANLLLSDYIERNK